MKKRLAKAIAESGVSSRRSAEELILSGNVTVDGEKILTPVFFVDESNDVKVNGISIKNKSNDIKIWRFYKPTGVLVTRDDLKKRKTVFDMININDQRLIYIGRLDLNSEGLLLFTNNGFLSRYFELPKSKIDRTYKVRAFGKLTDDMIKKMKNGITIDGIRYGSIGVEIIDQNRSNIWIKMTLTEGKNREIRKVLSHFGLQVNRLIRTSYGPYNLGSLKAGEIKEDAFLESSIKQNFSVS